MDQAHAYGLPVLNMVYDKTPHNDKDLANLRHFMRAAVELGVDALKVAPPDNLNAIPDLIDGIQEHTPVLFAGGALGDELSLFELVAAVVRHGATGICVGRNVFQRSNPRSIMERVLQLFRCGVPAVDFNRLAYLDEVARDGYPYPAQ